MAAHELMSAAQRLGLLLLFLRFGASDANGPIRDLVDLPCMPQRSNCIGTVTYEDEFQLEFDIVLHEAVPAKGDSHSIIHLAEGTDNSSLRYAQVPAIYQLGTQQLRVTMRRVGCEDCYCDTGLVPLNRKTHISMKVEGDIMTVAVDRALACRVTGYNGARFPSGRMLQIFLGDAWHSAAHASVGNIVYMPLAQGFLTSGNTSTWCSKPSTGETDSGPSLELLAVVVSGCIAVLGVIIIGCTCLTRYEVACWDSYAPAWCSRGKLFDMFSAKQSPWGGSDTSAATDSSSQSAPDAASENMDPVPEPALQPKAERDTSPQPVVEWTVSPPQPLARRTFPGEQHFLLADLFSEDGFSRLRKCIEASMEEHIFIRMEAIGTLPTTSPSPSFASASEHAQSFGLNLAPSFCGAWGCFHRSRVEDMKNYLKSMREYHTRSDSPIDERTSGIFMVSSVVMEVDRSQRYPEELVEWKHMMTCRGENVPSERAQEETCVDKASDSSQLRL